MKSDDNIDIFFLGDTYFGEWHMRLRARKGQYDVLAEKGYLHFAKAFNALLTGGDLVIANLECAITDIPVSPLAKEKKHVYAANREKTIAALKASNVSAVTLANNHAVDYGKAGLVDTLEALEEGDIRCLGAGRTLGQASFPLVFAKDGAGAGEQVAVLSCYNYGRISDGYGFYANERVPGVYKLDTEVLKQQISCLRSANPGLMVIVVPHWGPNYAWRSFAQQQMAEEVIRAGADMIVGHSAHMIQEIEYIQNRLVVYSIGNFILNGNGEYKRRNLPPFSFIACLHMAVSASRAVEKSVKLYPFVSDNLGTDFTPRLVSDSEFFHVHAVLRSHNYNPALFDDLVHKGCDMHGHYLECHVPTI